MPLNECIPLYHGGDKDLTYRVSADVVGKTFAAISGPIQSGGPTITSATLPTTYDGGNLQAATCAAGAKAVGVFAYDQLSGGVVPVIKKGNTVPVTAGGTVTAGQEVEVGANGRAITLASGKPAGLATTSATVGNDVFVELF